MLDYEQIKEIINKIDDSTLRVFELEDRDIKLKLSKNIESISYGEGSLNREKLVEKEEKPSNTIENIEEEVEKNSIEEKSEDITLKDESLNIVKSPLVGTFYASPTPDSEPYVKVGSKVKKGDILCIIEAMKVMNEITSEFDGEVVEVLKKDEDIVEYGMNLFKIR